ncbi:4-hydroxy-tetrahydrodipicolinate reductase 1 [Hibiscus syriacus]|uniref:4-hydroxy-tetrahydrodipicolinate reductase 1 n=1 Tax=Hibiscus syriacus TaxID=106335 RepID=A0A6A2X1A8_HIBSY|nr:4-hydroxy-tetrahydrodipicolinate reductase 1 [Hibiscus syriacus]
MTSLLKATSNVLRWEKFPFLSSPKTRHGILPNKPYSPSIPLALSSYATMETLQHHQKFNSPDIAIPILVNSCTGKMGKAVIKAANSAGLNVLPVSFGAEKDSGKTVEVCGMEIMVHGPSERESILAYVFQEYPNLIVVDYMAPATVNGNLNKTTGGDRDQLYKTVEESKVLAVISPQMGKQVVAFIAAMEIMAERAFSVYSLQVMESHHASKLDTSGNAKALSDKRHYVPSFYLLQAGSGSEGRIQMIRDSKQQVETVGVLEEHLAGHAFHLSKYAEGTVNALLFLAKKNGKLNEFGEFRTSVWSWHVQMRRNLSDWDLDQFSDLMDIIHNITLSHELSNRLVWRGNGEGIYTVNSSVKSCCPVSSADSFWMKNIWRELVPPRVEVFMWQVMYQRLNAIVFDGGRLDQIDLFFMARCRLASWFLANFKDVSILKDSLTSDLSLGDCCSNSRSSIIKIVSWSPPPKGFIKLNVDAAVSGDWRKSGVGGILRVEDGSVMGSFQEAAGPGPPLLIELMEIKKGLTFFASIHQRYKERLIVETDSKLAVDWVKNYDHCPYVYIDLVKDIVTMLRDLKGFIRWAARSANVEANSLAKAGIG